MDMTRQQDVLRRMIDLALAGEPLGAGELDPFTAAGTQQGELGAAPNLLRRALDATVKTLLHDLEAACESEGGDLLRVIGWLAVQGKAVRDAYWRGYFAGLDRSYSRIGRVQRLARMLLADDPAAGGLAAGLGLRLHGRYLVTVVRILDEPAATDGSHARVIEDLFAEWRIPMLWRDVTEFIALSSGEPATDGGQGALALVRRLAAVIGRACAAGATEGDIGALGQAAGQARQISTVARPSTSPERLYRLADVFVELAAARLPDIEEWLLGIAERLSAGPDLLLTLDHYYRHDMSRVRAAQSLKIHPRTLDYRLARVRELVDLDPGSVRGIRVLETIVARMSSGAWGGPGQNVS
jgi:PucR C-terminal helix-turn-helix domain